MSLRKRCSRIGRREALYRETANPIHGVRAFRWARYSKLPVPDWVLGPLKQMARDVDRLTPRGPGPTKIRQADKDERDLALIWRVRTLTQEHGDTPPLTKRQAFDRIAAEHHLSAELVRDIYHRRFRSSGDPL